MHLCITLYMYRAPLGQLMICLRLLGPLCWINIDDCASQPCLNSGTCVDGVNSYTCACAPGFTSTRCEVNINECSSLPCQNSGTCIDGVNSFFCLCPVSWTGATCGQDVDECASLPCQNNATCINGIGQFSCSCMPGYTGESLLDCFCVTIARCCHFLALSLLFSVVFVV